MGKFIILYQSDLRSLHTAILYRLLLRYSFIGGLRRIKEFNRSLHMIHKTDKRPHHGDRRRSTIELGRSTYISSAMRHEYEITANGKLFTLEILLTGYCPAL